MAFIALALLARYQRRPIATGTFIGLAFLIKLYPIILLPALFRRGEYRMVAVVAALTASAYACYASVGMRVFGFLGGYVKEEGIETGDRYFLLEQTHRISGMQTLPTAAYLAFCAIVLSGIVLWCWRTCCQKSLSAECYAQTRFFGLPDRADFLLPAFALSLVFMLLFSPHYPWYIAWLVPFFTLVPGLTIFTYIGAVFYLCTTALAVGYGPKQFRLNQMLYATVLIAFFIEAIMRLTPLQRIVFGTFHPNTEPPQVEDGAAS